MDGRSPAPAAFAVLKSLGWLVLALMLASVAYAGWIAVENWGSIRV